MNKNIATRLKHFKRHLALNSGFNFQGSYREIFYTRQVRRLIKLKVTFLGDKHYDSTHKLKKNPLS